MLTVVIQAGGESRRMGRDKALIPFLGRPLIERVIARLRPVADELLVIANHTEGYPDLGVRIFSDLKPGRGALGGQYTALAVSRQPLVAVVACDMPFVNSDLLAYQRDRLVENQMDIAIPQNEGYMEPFHAVYRRATCLAPAAAALEAGAWRADAWYSQVQLCPISPAEVARYDPDGVAFFNVNTLEDLAQAEKLARQQAPPT